MLKCAKCCHVTGFIASDWLKDTNVTVLFRVFTNFINTYHPVLSSIVRYDTTLADASAALADKWTTVEVIFNLVYASLLML